MTTSIKMVIVLTIIATISGGVLSSWDIYTTPKIEEHRRKALLNAIAEVLPEYDHYEQIKTEEVTLYIGKNEADEIVGIAFQASGSGFQGKILMMVGIEPDFVKLTGIKILEQVETPGLGTKIVEDPSKKSNPYWFSDQFKGVKTSPEITVIKNIEPTTQTEIQAVTGATISSLSIVRIINNTVQQVKSAYQSIKEHVS